MSLGPIPREKDFKWPYEYVKVLEEWIEEASEFLKNPMYHHLKKAQDELEEAKKQLTIQVTAARRQAVLFVQSNEAYEREIAEMVPFEFIEWYSGMEKQKILNAIKRWQREKA